MGNPGHKGTSGSQQTTIRIGPHEEHQVTVLKGKDQTGLQNQLFYEYKARGYEDKATGGAKKLYVMFTSVSSAKSFHTKGIVFRWTSPADLISYYSLQHFTSSISTHPVHFLFADILQMSFSKT